MYYEYFRLPSVYDEHYTEPQWQCILQPHALSAASKSYKSYIFLRNPISCWVSAILFFHALQGLCIKLKDLYPFFQNQHPIHVLPLNH